MESIVCAETSQIFVVKKTYFGFVTVTPDILHCSLWGGDCILNDIQLGYKWYLLRIYENFGSFSRYQVAVLRLHFFHMLWLIASSVVNVYHEYVSFNYIHNTSKVSKYWILHKLWWLYEYDDLELLSLVCWCMSCMQCSVKLACLPLLVAECPKRECFSGKILIDDSLDCGGFVWMILVVN